MSTVHENGRATGLPVHGSTPTVFHNIRLSTQRCQALSQRALTIQPRRITAMVPRFTVFSNISTYRNSTHLSSCSSITGTRSMTQLHRSPPVLGNDCPPRRQSTVSLSSRTPPTEAPSKLDKSSFDQVQRQSSQSYCVLPQESKNGHSASSFPHPCASSTAHPTANLNPLSLPQVPSRSCTPTARHNFGVRTAHPVHPTTPSHATPLHARQLRFLPGSHIKIKPLRAEPLNNFSFSRTRAHLRAYNHRAPHLPTSVNPQCGPPSQCSPVRANPVATRPATASPRVIVHPPPVNDQSATCTPVRCTNVYEPNVVEKSPTLDLPYSCRRSHVILNSPLERVSEHDTVATTNNESPCPCSDQGNDTATMLFAGGRLDAESTWMDEDNLANSSDDNGASVASTDAPHAEVVDTRDEADSDVDTGRAKWKKELEALGHSAGGRQSFRPRDEETMSDTSLRTPRQRRLEELSEISRGSSLSLCRTDDQWQRRVAVLDMSDMSDDDIAPTTPRRKEKKMRDRDLSETDEDESVRLETPRRFPMHLSFVTRFNREQRQRESEKPNKDVQW